MEYLSIFLHIVNIVVVLYVTFKVTDLREKVTDLLAQYEGEEIGSSDELDTMSEAELSYEEHIAEREQAFNDRITQMKQELDQEQPPRKPTKSADVLHPDVENLPHDSIIDYQTNPPDIEYVD